MDGNLLGRFLRDRRARITVEAAGLPPRRSGRSATLTQEDLAQLTGYSIRTISALEQGAEHRPTRDLLEAITAALRLSGEERRTLWQLASGAPPPEDSQIGPDHDPVLSRIVDKLDPCVAYLCDAAYNIQCHNRAFTSCVWDFMAQPPERRNFARWLFGHPHARHILPNWQTDTRAFVARLRQVYARLPGARRLRGPHHRPGGAQRGVPADVAHGQRHHAVPDIARPRLPTARPHRSATTRRPPPPRAVDHVNLDPDGGRRHPPLRRLPVPRLLPTANAPTQRHMHGLPASRR